MKALLFPLFTLLLFSYATSFAVEPVADTSVIAQAKAIRLPRVEFRGASVSEAVDFLIYKSKRIDPSHQGVKIALSATVTPKASITFALTEASVYDILQVVAEQAELNLQPTENVIVLAPKAK